jgi:hypothetical protein
MDIDLLVDMIKCRESISGINFSINLDFFLFYFHIYSNIENVDVKFLINFLYHIICPITFYKYVKHRLNKSKEFIIIPYINDG